MSSMAIEWGCCSLELKDNKYKLCSKCGKAHHFSCLTWEGDYVTMEQSSDWIGPCCVRCIRAADEQDTPARTNPNATVRASKRQALSSPPVNTEGPVTLSEVRNIMEDVIQKHMSDLMVQMNINMRSILDSELKIYRNEINEVKQTVIFMNSEFEAAKEEKAIYQEATKNLQENNIKLSETVKVLETRINNLEQSSRNNNIEVQCLPEKKSENLMTLFRALCDVVKSDIDENQINRITRIAKLNPKSERPRSIVVEFSSTRTRDAFLAATINYNKKNPGQKLNASHFGISGSMAPVYVTEHLSAANKALHSAARLAAKDKGFKYVWVRGGRIFMRKSEGSGFILIKDFETLSKLE